MKTDAMDQPAIKLFKHRDYFYVYDAYANNVFRITSRHYKELHILLETGFSKYRAENRIDREYKDILALYNKGIFKCDFVKTIKHPESKYVQFLLERHINDISLQVTRECNFNCRYCLYTNEHGLERRHESINMSWEIAKKSVDYLYAHSSDARKIGVSFYGGEPLINFQLIKRVVGYCKSLFYTKRVEYRMTTNASLFTDEIIDYIVSNNFNIAISLDGDEKTHDNHRRFAVNGRGTFATIIKVVEKIRNKAPEYFKNYVSFISVAFDDECREDIMSFFNSIGISSENVLIEDAELGGIDYIPNINGYLNISESNDLLFRQIYENKEKIPSEWHHNGPCIPAVKRLFVDTYGILYPCEKIVEHNCLSIGNVDSGVNISKVVDFMNIGKLTEKECKKCWAMRFCDICIASCNDISAGCITAKQKMQACHYLKSKTLTKIKRYIDEISGVEKC